MKIGVIQYARKLTKQQFIQNQRNRLRIHWPADRIIPGNMVYELIHNARTIGADNKSSQHYERKGHY